ncbi:tetratricopeptide repeat protein [Microtetraspora sp. AC03309]|uniref:ATP-binding protein n=1 Tax=Microtetraspora sp. AC03309 TaxID=2779376 RepID=UPI001E3B5A72|nr:tetratricopeptide repeat protein [Microtetraspora sp. AC03309]MCC5578848.1 tetratricopeptide repeat protein [Microtetraspora sp. AC03309]
MATPAGWRREGNLPAELTSFVGRTRLLATIRQRLRDSRLVTVTGIGGVGKSRTALRIAHLVRQQFKDGVWYADLARLQDAGMVHHTITSALGIADQSHRAGSETLAEWLGDREILLILDTCEHLVDACAELTQELLARAPNLRIVATSRRSLNAPGEHTIAIPPLAVPGDDPSESPYTNEAVQLFAERGSAVVPDFVVDESNVSAVSELCRRLDGIPLAIELAAVRLRALSVEQILALLTDRFSLLAGASRTALPRHQTLRAAIGWSHELCEPAERLLWARLSVFAGDFDLDAARYVCAGDGLEAASVLDVITGLVDKSILFSFATPVGHRYRLIDTLRQYGAEWLEKLGETEALRRRHRDHYLQLAQRGEHSWSGPRQVQWYVRMRQEHDNIRVALDYCLSDPIEARVGQELLSSLWFLWVACGFAREGAVYLERALAASRVPSKERCKALWVLAYIRSAQGDLPGALAAAEECSSEAVRAGDSGAVILATKMQGTTAMLQGDAKKATALLGVAIEFHRGGRELNPGLLPAIVELSMVLFAQGDFAEAEGLLEDCVKVCTERGEQWLRSYAWYATSQVQRATGRRDEALESCKSSLRIKRYFHDVLGIVLCVDVMAGLYLEMGRPEYTAHLLGAAQTNWRTFGLPQFGSPFFTNEHEQCVKECRKLLGDAAYQEAYSRGTRLSLSELIEYALDDFDEPHVPD